MPEATIITARWKLICCFRSLASRFLLKTRNSRPNTLGRVPLTLLNSISAHGCCCIVLASRLFLLRFIQFGGDFISWEMVRPLTHLDTLSCITVCLLLNRVVVKVPYNVAPFILAGLRKTKELAG